MEKNLPTNVTLGTATESVLLLKNEMGRNIIELGRWISATKQIIPRGEWMDWLKYEVKIPYTTAWRFMKVFNEVDSVTLEKVGFRKVVEILELPPSKFRDDLMEVAPSLSTRQVDAIKKGEMTVESATDIIEAVIESETDIDMALESNAVLLDALFRIKVGDLDDAPRELLMSQLRQTPVKINKFLEEAASGPE